MHRAVPVAFLAALTACSVSAAIHPRQQQDKLSLKDLVADPPRSIETNIEAANELLVAVKSTPSEVPGNCPTGMIEVEGTYCPTVSETCLYWVDINGIRSEAAKPSARFPTSRCGEWAYPTKCLTPEARRPHVHYCIDKYEYPNVEGQRPQSWMNWYDVKVACESKGKRLCTKPEWEFACEGPDMQPYPYKGGGAHPGYTRDKAACNFDNSIPEDPLRPINPVTGKHFPISVFDAKQPGDRVASILQDLLKPSGSMPECVSPFGVYDQVGNLDEFIEGPVKHHWTVPEHNGGKVDKGPFISGLMSGHVFGVRNQCRAITDGHNEGFNWYETGGRCCEDPVKED